ncbi:hypothetical protein ABZS53_15295 [Streptomyces sp. NPDC005499]|uniref:hypothetical protein n=1 Tax=Streptomyces sp. NPDC005499 TaxID=3154883 RepID=UPI0033BCABBC
MTEGLIAVLGALVGAAGAWIAALIAGKASRYQADKQAVAAHEQWLRQIRRDLYAGFLAEARAAVVGHFSILSVAWDATLRRTMGLPPSEETYRRSREALYGLTRAAEALQLESPLEVHRHATAFTQACWQFVESAIAYLDETAASEHPVPLPPGDRSHLTRVTEPYEQVLRRLEELTVACRTSIQGQ